MVLSSVDKKYGDGSWKQFEREVDTKCARMKSVLALLKKQPWIQAKDREVTIQANYLYYQMNWTDQRNVYEVIDDTPLAIAGDRQWRKYFKLRVKAEAETTQIISDKAEPY